MRGVTVFQLIAFGTAGASDRAGSTEIAERDAGIDASLPSDVGLVIEAQPPMFA